LERVGPSQPRRRPPATTFGAQRGVSLRDASQYKDSDVLDMELCSVEGDVEYSRTWGSEVDDEIPVLHDSEWQYCDSEVAFKRLPTKISREEKRQSMPRCSKSANVDCEVEQCRSTIVRMPTELARS